MPDINADVDLRDRILHLERRVVESEREFATLLQIAQTVSSTLDLQSLLSIILDQLKTQIDYDAAGIILVENDTARFFEYRGPIPRELILSWRFSQTVSGYQAATQSDGALVIGDVWMDPSFSRIYGESLGDLAKYFVDVRAWMAVPLIAREHVIGFLRMSHTQPNFFTAQHARFAQAVAKHAAIAIDNARLLEAEHERLYEVERRRQVAESLRGILAMLNSNTPSDQILDYILEQGCRFLHTDTAVIYRLNTESAVLIPRASRNIPPDIYRRFKIPIGQGIVGQAVAQRKPVEITDFDAVPIPADMNENREYLVNWAKQNFVSMLGIPMLSKDQVYGGISLYFRERCCPFTDDDMALAMSFADQAALAIENARLYAQVSEIASLEERQRLARELHDSVSQALYGIQLGAQTARELLNDGSSESELKAALVEPLDYVSSLAEAGLAEMRSLIFELRPEALKSEGLVGALTKQANAVRVRHHLQVETKFSDEPDMSFEAKEALYRIAQESMHNIVKHAHATKITLQLHREDTQIVLCVIDNGKGFDTSGTFPGHLGLRSMRERAMRLDGTLKIESAPKQGTKICVRIPHRAL